jgi:3-carboxy-cis,cis-muconate cycloisomerase
MPTILDSAIFGPLFQEPELARVFEDRAYVQRLLEVEVALARVEGRLGVIPPGAAERIARVRADQIDLPSLARGTARDGFPVIALVRAIREQAGPEAAPYVHWGATTQDIMDTAAVLQLRAAASILRSRLVEVARSLAARAESSREIVLAGRTHGQQALPITFGLKVAGWLAPLLRHLERLDGMSPRLFVVQFGGAAGTLAALGGRGEAVARALAQELGLFAPETSWHTQRDGLAEFASWLSLVSGSLGKIAQDVILLAQTEVAEVEETEESVGASSTMPQKKNPITSELILAAARANAALLSAMHQALIQEHERATHGWQLEWLSLPPMVVLTGGALRHAAALAAKLKVDPVRMRDNVARAGDVVLAEAAALALAEAIGREEAHELVKRASAAAAAGGKSMVVVLREMVRERAPQAGVDWEALARPELYLGEASRLVGRVLEKAARLARG